MARSVKRAEWRNRIVGHGEEVPDQLLANALNWRIHPKAQQEALSGVLDEVGWVQDIIVNRRTGNVVDGHLRASLAIGRGEKSVPVVYVDLSEHEERLILATIDPLSAMAATDTEQLAALLGEITVSDASLQSMLADLGTANGIPTNAAPLVEDPDPGPDGYREQYGVIVMCADESEQEQVYEALKGEGYSCRVVTT